MPQDPLNDLFNRALGESYEDELAWEAIHTLRTMGTRDVFIHAAEWCVAPSPLQRARGVDILAQLGRTAGNSQTLFPEETFVIVSDLLKREHELLPLSSAIVALGHLRDSRAIPLILPFASHLDATLRYNAAFSLGSFADDPESTGALIGLTEDTDAEVRNWATFGLGVIGNTDSPEIRDALVHRLADDFADAREEAMVGLAKRKDVRVLPTVLKCLESESCSMAIEAARFWLDLEDKPEPFSANELLSLLRNRQ
jgi:HEAT repeat protein